MPDPQPISAVIVAVETRVDPALHGDADQIDKYGAINLLMDVLAQHSDEIIIVAADPLDCLAHDALIVRLHQGKPGPLGAVYAGLFAARHPQALVIHWHQVEGAATGVKLLTEAAEPRWDAVAMASSDGPGLFPAVYHKRCLKILGRMQTGEPQAAERFFKQVRVRYIRG